MKRIAIDMDDVMADTSQRKLDWYERDFGVKYNKGSIDNQLINDFIPSEHQVHVSLYSQHKDFFWDLDIMPNCQAILEQLTEKFEVFIVTAAIPFPNSYNAKYEWLKEHFPFIDERNIVFCGHKYIIDADYLIDDHPFNLETFKGTGLLYTAPHNTAEKRFERVNDWQEVKDYFLNS